MLLLFADELIESLLIHICHQLIEDLRIIQGHILKELRKLVYWYGYHFP